MSLRDLGRLLESNERADHVHRRARRAYGWLRHCIALAAQLRRPWSHVVVAARDRADRRSVELSGGWLPFIVLIWPPTGANPPFRNKRCVLAVVGSTFPQANPRPPLHPLSSSVGLGSPHGERFVPGGWWVATRSIECPMTPSNATALFHVLGFLTASALYVMLAAMTLGARSHGRAGRVPGGRSDLIPLATAVLGLVWNVGELVMYGLHATEGAAPPWLIVLAFGALFYLPAVVIHSALAGAAVPRADAHRAAATRTLVVAAYALIP